MQKQGFPQQKLKQRGDPGGMGLQKWVLAEGHLVALSIFATAWADSSHSLTAEAEK